MRRTIRFCIEDNELMWDCSIDRNTKAMGTLSIDTVASGESMQRFADNLETLCIRLNPTQYSIITSSNNALTVKLETLIDLITYRCNVVKTQSVLKPNELCTLWLD